MKLQILWPLKFFRIFKNFCKLITPDSVFLPIPNIVPKIIECTCTLYITKNLVSVNLRNFGKIERRHKTYKTLYKKSRRNCPAESLRRDFENPNFFIRFESYGSRKNLPSVTDHFYFFYEVIFTLNKQLHHQDTS